MNTTDEQFRSDLAEALDASAHDVAPFDTTFLVDAGARRVRQRRIAAGATAAVAVLALAGGGWAVLGRGNEPIVAAPTPSPAAPTAPAAPVDATAVLTVPGTQSEGGNPATDFRVRVSGASDLTVEYSQVLDGTTTLLGRTLIGNGAQVLWNTPSKDVVLGLVPREATRAGLLEDANTGGTTAEGDLVDLPGTPYKAFAFRLYSVPAEPSPTLTVMWWLSDGTPVSNNGVGESVVFDEGSDRYSLWALPGDQRIGMDGPDGGWSRADWGATSDPRVKGIEGTSYVEDQGNGSYSARLRYIYVIKGELSGVAATFDDDRLVNKRVKTTPWPQMGGTAVFIGADLPTQPGPQVDGGPLGLTGLTWTDADGVRQEWKT